MLAGVASLPRTAGARDLWRSRIRDRWLVLESALKSSLLLARAPDDPLLFPERSTASGLWRLRTTLTSQPIEWLTAQVAYEHRVRILSDASAGSGGVAILPADARAPFRIRQLDWPIVEQDTYGWRHELDRGYVSLHPAWGEITLGRQAIGLGRGVLFGAVDVLAPFSPLEVDREWRRGVDALHVELSPTAWLSLGVIGALGEPLEDSIALGRVRARVGELDGELLFGRRAEDWMLAATSSATLGDAAVYGEAAFFRTDGRGIDGGWLGDDRWVAKLLAGASYRFDVGEGLRVFAEYHYSGFGLRHARDATTLLLDEDFQRRFARGDSQLLGRHAFALSASYDLFADLEATLTALVSPVDGSGLVAPGLRWSYSDTVSLVASGFLPWGARPRDATLRSEHGATPFAALLQLSIYD